MRKTFSENWQWHYRKKKKKKKKSQSSNYFTLGSMQQQSSKTQPKKKPIRRDNSSPHCYYSSSFSLTIRHTLRALRHFLQIHSLFFSCSLFLSVHQMASITGSSVTMSCSLKQNQVYHFDLHFRSVSPSLLLLQWFSRFCFRNVFFVSIWHSIFGMEFIGMWLRFKNVDFTAFLEPVWINWFEVTGKH